MRSVINLNRKWAFTKRASEVPTALHADWDWVNLPHTWNAIDGQDGDGDYFRGTAYYVKNLSKADLPTADQYYLELQGANSSADVYVNGKHLAHHDGGYSTWRVHMTDALASDNLIVVAVDNSPNKTVYPQMADFTFYGGLYRNVNVICVNHSHFDLDYYGGPGLKITPEICGSDASVEIETFVTNARPGQKIRYTIASRCGCKKFQTESEATRAVLTIPNVHLWHGRKDPYLYTATAELLENGEVLDMISTRFGCRTFKIDPVNGFILNGEEYPLRGVSRHQDRWELGNALLPEHHNEDMDLMCELGCNTIRLAHYQHDQYFYDLCDERGMVLWAEIPYISRHMPAGRDNTISQMKELVVQNYNHSSIVVWGLSNEISIGGFTDDVMENHRILNDLCHEMDKTRPTVIAAVSMCPTDDPYLLIPDVVSYNHYFGWYGGEVSMYAPWFDEFHAAHPDIPIGCSEYGCEALNWHSSKPFAGDYSEEYQAYYHEELIKQLFPRKYIWATHVWNMFDFGADGRNEGGENGQNHKGLVTFDRKYKKDSFYAYKAWLSDEPFVHLCSKRYIDRVEDVTKVTVYSNLPEVELFANGISLGKKTAADHFFRFDVPNIGTTKLEAVAGGCRDESVINKVETFNNSYRLVEKGAILNWFDMETTEGYFSINDRMNQVIATETGKQAFLPIMKKMFGGYKPQGDSDSAKLLGFEVPPPMLAMMGGFTILRLFTILSNMVKVELTKEDLLELNANLSKLKKPD